MHDHVAFRPQLLLYEPQHVLLVHRAGGMDVGVDLADVVEVAVGDTSLLVQLPYLVEEDVELELVLEKPANVGTCQNA